MKDPRFELRIAYHFQVWESILAVPIAMLALWGRLPFPLNLLMEMLVFAYPVFVYLSFKPRSWKLTYADDHVSLRHWGRRKSIEISSLAAIANFQNSSLKLVRDDGKVYLLGKLLDGNLALLDFAKFCRENNYAFRMKGEEPGRNGWQISTYLTRAINWNWKEASGYQSKGSLDIDKSPQEISIKDDVLILRREGREVMSAPLADCEIIKTSNGAITAGDSRLMVEVLGQGRWPLVDWNSPDQAEVIYVLTERGVPVRGDLFELAGSSHFVNRTELSKS